MTLPTSLLLVSVSELTPNFLSSNTKQMVAVALLSLLARPKPIRPVRTSGQRNEIGPTRGMGFGPGRDRKRAREDPDTESPIAMRERRCGEEAANLSREGERGLARVVKWGEGEAGREREDCGREENHMLRSCTKWHFIVRSVSLVGPSLILFFPPPCLGCYTVTT